MDRRAEESKGIPISSPLRLPDSSTPRFFSRRFSTVHYINYTLYINSNVVVVGAVEMWKAEMCTAAGFGVKKVGRSSPSLSTPGSPGKLTDAVNLPQKRKLLTYPPLSTGNGSPSGRTCTPSSTLWMAGGIVWAMAGFRHGCPHAPDARCVVQSFYRGFTHVVNRGGKGLLHQSLRSCRVRDFELRVSC